MVTKPKYDDIDRILAVGDEVDRFEQELRRLEASAEDFARRWRETLARQRLSGALAMHRAGRYSATQAANVAGVSVEAFEQHVHAFERWLREGARR